MLEKVENRISIFNEIMVSVYLITTISLTNFQGDNPIQSECGMALVGIVLFTLTINLVKFLILSLAKTFRVVKLKC